MKYRIIRKTINKSKERIIQFFFIIKKKPLILIIIILCMLLSILLIKGYKISRRSYICPRCHYMEAYYEKWQTSSHNKIECIKCHKLGLGKQIGFALKYLSGMYSPRAHSIIDNDSCLQQSCHTMDLLKKETVYEGFVRFNHFRHLSNNVRGINLKCVSCHYQIVQGAHISVSKDTCFLCHFYRLPQTAPLMGCPSCHYPPKKKIVLANFEFNHKPYLDMKVNCSQCHTKVLEGDGNVAAEKCGFCHIKPEINFADSIRIHKQHITILNNNCFTCHNIIKHSKFEMSKIIKPDCKKCHQNKHTYAEIMYMGTGFAQIKNYPSKMFLARVSCEGCHISDRFKQTEEEYKKSCRLCHSKKYAALVKDWIKISNEIISSLNLLIIKNKNALENQKIIEIKEAIDKGKIIHNPLYGYRLINKLFEDKVISFNSEDNLNKSLNNSCRYFCHPALEFKKFNKVKIEEFPHPFHEEKVGCLTCHSSVDHPKTKEIAFNCMECHHRLAKDIKCDNCHKSERKMLQGILIKEVKAELNPMGDLECSQCHTAFEASSISSDVKKNCLNCHEKGYEDFIQQWKKEWEESFSNLGLIIWKKEESISLNSKCFEELKKIKNDYQLLNKGKGVHNLIYAESAIDYLKNKLMSCK